MAEYRLTNESEDYRVGDDGSVWSFKTGEWKLMHPALDSDGYPRVCLYVDGRRIFRFVHQLVLAAFVGPCPDGMEARHGDGVRTNNTPRNLSWGTTQENKADSIRHGTYTHGERMTNARLTVEEVEEIRREYEAGQSQTAIANRRGIGQQHVSKIVRRQKWKSVA